MWRNIEASAPNYVRLPPLSGIPDLVIIDELELEISQGRSRHFLLDRDGLDFTADELGKKKKIPFYNQK